MKVTLKALKGLKGLTSYADSNCNGVKDKAEHLLALSILLDKMVVPADRKELTVDSYSVNGKYMETLTFNVAEVYKYCKMTMLTVHESIDDLRKFLDETLEKLNN